MNYTNEQFQQGSFYNSKKKNKAEETANIPRRTIWIFYQMFGVIVPTKIMLFQNSNTFVGYQVTSYTIIGFRKILFQFFH